MTVYARYRDPQLVVDYRRWINRLQYAALICDLARCFHYSLNKLHKHHFLNYTTVTKAIKNLPPALQRGL